MLNFFNLKLIIFRKGANAYYYAHGNTSTEIDFKVYDNKPIKLDIGTKKTVTSSGFIKPIKKYSWADFKKTVRVYIEIDGIDELKDENINLEFLPNTSNLKLKLTNVGTNKQTHELVLNKLHEKVRKVVYKKKEGNRLVLYLHKGDDSTWYELQLK